MLHPDVLYSYADENALDPRWDDEELSAIRGVHGRDFEVVYTGEPVTD